VHQVHQEHDAHDVLLEQASAAAKVAHLHAPDAHTAPASAIKMNPSTDPPTEPLVPNISVVPADGGWGGGPGGGGDIASEPRDSGEEESLFAEYLARRSKEIKGVFLGGDIGVGMTASASPLVGGTGHGGGGGFELSGANSVQSGCGDDGERGGGVADGAESEAMVHLGALRSYIRDSKEMHS